MHKIFGYACAALAAAPLLANAEDFDYEANFGFSQVDIDSTVTTMFPDLPATSTSTDLSVRNLSLGGTWFFEGLSDDKGPRALAAFVDRASSLTVRYNDVSGDADSNGVSLSGRYVWKNSGWFVRGAFANSEQNNGPQEIDVSTINATLGKYIGETTSIELALISQDVDFASTLFGSQSSSNSGVALSFDHLGDLNAQWQYSVGLSASSESFNGSSGRYTGNFSLYPNRDISLDLGITSELGGGGSDGTAVSIGAGWFFTPQLEGNLRLGFFDEGDENPDSAFVDVDTDRTEVGISIRYRF
ncbi:MAG: putative porin [Woeseiaceae bacterium]